MGELNEQFIQLISAKLQSFKPFAEAFGKSRFLVYESEIQAPDEKADAAAAEAAEMEAIANAFKCDIVLNNNTFTLFFFMDERNPGHFLEIVDAGMPPPLAGGDEGTAHNPDGSTYQSSVPYQLWGQPVPGYAKPATGVINEIRTMLADLFRTEMQEVISSSKSEFMKLTKEEVANRLKGVMGG